jgi:histidyl-tRNA synthetase
VADDDQAAVRAPTGTHDVLWPVSHRWEMLVAMFARSVEGAGYGLVHTPMFEDVRLFRRGIGESTDVVGKEMYELTDRGGRTLALRPEGTAPIVRAFVQHRPPLPWKAWYVTPAFRYERPQAGRYRQHHQVGLEALGTEDPDLDAEVIALADGFLRRLGLQRLTLLLNSMGDRRCRPAYVELLRRSLADRRQELCEEHRQRYELNPLRVLDCKRPECRAVTADVPLLADHLCDECRAHLARVRQGLEHAGVAYRMDHRLVRGLDYYTRTTFEVAAEALDASQNAVAGGGRYDELVELLDGPPTPGIGFGSGIERVLLACDAEGVFDAPPPPLDAFVVDVVGGAAARDLTFELRGAGLRADRAYDSDSRSLRSQLRSADRSGALLALIVGRSEEADHTVTVRELRHTEGEAHGQQRVPRDKVVEVVRSFTARTAGSS